MCTVGRRRGVPRNRIGALRVFGAEVGAIELELHAGDRAVARRRRRGHRGASGNRRPSRGRGHRHRRGRRGRRCGERRRHDVEVRRRGVLRPRQADLTVADLVISGDEVAGLRARFRAGNRRPRRPRRSIELAVENRVRRVGVDGEQPEARPVGRPEQAGAGFEGLPRAERRGLDRHSRPRVARRCCRPQRQARCRPPSGGTHRRCWG